MNIGQVDFAEKKHWNYLINGIMPLDSLCQVWDIMEK
jgi:hypothetical protein